MDQEYTLRIIKIDAELERWLPLEPDSEWAQKVFGDIGKKINVDEIKLLLTPLRELLFRGGKRWRPLLMTLVCEALGNNKAAKCVDAAIKLSPVVEFSHNASLIHDDIEDSSDERRGKPAIHKMFGTDVAINSGSFFYFLASACIDEFETSRYKDDIFNKGIIYKLWMDCMRRLHLGQSMDINWHRNITFVPKTQDYFLMCAMKTGSLARLSTEIGAVLSDSLDMIQVLGEAADKMGVGFQIIDDVKNLTTGIQGKKRGDDVVEGKKSLPIIMFLNKYPEKQKQIFEIFSAAKQKGSGASESEQKIDELCNILNSSGIIEEAEKTGKTLLDEAKEIFHNGKLTGSSAKINLDNFINLIS